MNGPVIIDEYLDKIVVGNSGEVVTEIWNQSSLIWAYSFDEAPPVLTVTAPGGLSSTSPTYVFTSTYTVTGTVMDEDGEVDAVFVNGEAATINGTNWSKQISLSADIPIKIDVYAVDTAGNQSETISRWIWYDSAAPALTVTSPSGTTSTSPTYTTSSSITVSGTVSDPSGIASLKVNGTAVTVNANGSFSTTLTLTANTTTTITVVATDNAGRTSTVTRYAFYDSAAPSLSVTAPTGTSTSAPTYTTSSSITVSGTVSDASGIASLTVNGTATSVASNGTWSRAVSLTANTATTITVVATDNAGRTSTVTRYAFYDSAAPSLSVTAPTGTSSSSPTYVQIDSTYSYTVSGSVSDASGIASLTVNGTATSVASNGTWSRALSLATNTTHTVTVVATDNTGRKTTVTRYVRVEAYYQYAARLAGTTPQASLSATLTNTTVMNAIAGNATARSIMKNNYASNMVSYIDSNYNAGLNLTNYRCQLKSYLFKDGADTGAVTYSIATIGSERGNWVARREYDARLYIYVFAGMYLKVVAINFSGWKKVRIKAMKAATSYDGACGFIGLSSHAECDFNSDNYTFDIQKTKFDPWRNPAWIDLDLTNYQKTYYLKWGSVLGFGGDPARTCYIYDVTIE